MFSGCDMLTKRQKHLGFSVSDSLDARVSNFMMNALKMPKKKIHIQNKKHETNTREREKRVSKSFEIFAGDLLRELQHGDFLSPRLWVLSSICTTAAR